MNVRVLMLIGALLALTSCERPSPEIVQRGYRGTGMLEVFNPRLEAAKVALNQAPDPLPAIPAGTTLAKDVYKNVKVLTDVEVSEFTRLMLAMTNWVSPEQGCNYCHVAGNFESDDLYTKVVARRMLEMTRNVNSTWSNHVAATGVTCYTCHRGQPVPANVWFTDPQGVASSGFAGWRNGQNAPSKSVGGASLPSDPFTAYFLQTGNVRVEGDTALRSDHVATIQHTEWTYGLMMHISQSLGVNCTYCHNSRAFSQWDQSTPQRVTAWQGIRMVRDLNTNYLEPLKSTFPPTRLGAGGDSPKLNCATCHQGAFKPLYGASMVKDYQELATANKP